MVLEEKSLKNERKFFAYFQLFVIVGFLFSNPVLLGGVFYGSTSLSEEGGFSEKIFEGIGDFFSINQIAFVSADSDDWCCVKGNSDGGGLTCANVSSSVARDSCSKYKSTHCGEVDACRSDGTCVFEEGLSCTGNPVKWKCEDNGGVWKNQPRSEISSCQKGCCNLGSRVDYMTWEQCNREAGKEGTYNVDFDKDKSRQQCFSDFRGDLERGACVSSSGSCEITTPGDCQTEGTDKEFHEGKLCTNSGLNTGCEPTTQTRCSDTKGDYNVYFVDSCGNLANVYDSSKTYEKDSSYWQEVKESSCSSEPGSSSCGKCQYDSDDIHASRSKCARVENEGNVDYGNYICESLTCTDKNGNKRVNGESWCVYESDISKNFDTVGSDHWLRHCENGEVKTDKSQSKRRNDICAEHEIERNGETISQAQYRPNTGMACLSYNDKDNTKSRCSSNPDCKMLDMKVSRDAGIWEELCVPKYPTGFDFGDGSSEDQQEICGAASITCTRVEKRDTNYDDYISVGDSFVCTHYEFTKKANRFCRSLGDCGGDVNVEGAYQRDMVTRPFKTLNDDSGPQGKFKYGYDRMPWEKTAAFGGNYDPTAKILQGLSNPSNSPQYIPGQADSQGYGDLDSLISGKTSYEPNLKNPDVFLPLTSELLVRGWNQNAVGIPGVDQLLFGTVAAIVSGAVEIVLKVFGVDLGGDVKKTDIEFTCKPWSPPAGHGDCSACQDGELPCTEYKCNSLGQHCELKGKNTKNPVCADQSSDDKTVPKIEFKGTNLDKSYGPLEDDRGVKIDGCIESNTDLEVRLSTSENGDSQNTLCGYDYSHVEYSEVSDNDINNVYSKTSPGWLEEHSFEERITFSQDTDYFGDLYNIEETDIEKTANLDLNFRCQDPSGWTQSEEYTVRLCLSSKDKTPPEIDSFDPEDGGYVEYGKNRSNVTLSLNEPVSGCRYDFNSKGFYEDLSKEFDCAGNTCNKFPMKNLDSEENEIYIMCNDTAGNFNEQPFEYVLHETNDPLEVDSMEISSKSSLGEETYNSSELLDSNLTVGGDYPNLGIETSFSGGAPTEDYSCEYVFDKKPSGLRGLFGSSLESNGGKSFSGKIRSLLPGEYGLSVSCTDGVNEDTESTSFDLDVDNEAPDIIGNETAGGDINVFTDEPSQCSYSPESCQFAFDEGEPFGYGFGEENYVTEQSVEWNPSQPYNIRCRDDLGNEKCTKMNEADTINGPQITRIWGESGDLRIRTDREAQCYYGFEGCGFNILGDNPENSMSGSSPSTEHSTEWSPSNRYYIKCKDQWGNPNPSCAAIVSPHSL